MNPTPRLVIAALLILTVAGAARAETFRVVAFNVESGGADPGLCMRGFPVLL